MMPDLPDWLFPLAVFSEGSLASSVVTTVWIGVFVIAFFNLRFGWVLSGLVVPGYLVPLLIARPASFAVIVFEASVTYFLVWLFSERLSGGRSWSSLFGRDRFVALVLASVVVRLTFDAWLLPGLAGLLERELALAIDWHGSLHSFGLIVISLLANQLWKPGYLRGMSQAFVTIGITYLLVRYGLMELTNFRISAVSYLYEDLASNILATPKAYMILIVTALLASRMNLRFGWDFNGVLIPALIALQWYQPLKVVTSFVEAFVIYGIGMLLLRLPIFANTTIEGARKVLLFFNISFAYRLLIGHVLFWTGADVQVTDYYGFGYLLSTLMAIKMFEKGILARLTRATLQISVLGAAAGSAIGFAMAALLPPSAPTRDMAGTDTAAVVERGADPLPVLGREIVAAYAAPEDLRAQTPSAAEFEAFRAGVRGILAEGAEGIEASAALLQQAGYGLERLDPGGLALVDRTPGRNGGTFLVRPQATHDLTVSVPDPAALPGLLPAALEVVAATGARALALAGTSESLGGEAVPDFERDYATFFQAFHDAATGGILRLAKAQQANTPPSLRIPRRMPSGLDAEALRELLGPVDVGFGRDSARSAQENLAEAGFATLRLDAEDIRRVLAAEGMAPRAIEGADGIQGVLRDLGQGAGLSGDPLGTAELRYIDREILTPILRDVVPSLSGRDPGNLLAPVRRAARVMGYEVVLYQHEASGRTHLVLTPMAEGWGVYAFRLGGEGTEFVIQAPRAGSELNTLDYALSLYDRLDARALLIPPLPVSDSSQSAPDMLDWQRPPTLFDLVSQALVREAPPGEMMLVQARGFSAETAAELPPFDLFVGFATLPAEGDLTSLGDRLVAELRSAGAEVGLVRGEAETAGLEVGGVRQARYLEIRDAAEFAVVWLSPVLRSAYAEQDLAGSETALFEALGISTVERAPSALLADQGVAPTGPLPPDLVKALAAYAWRRDAVALGRAKEAWRGTLLRVYDPRSRQTFVAVLDDEEQVRAVTNLTPRDPAQEVMVEAGAPDRSAIDRFVDARAAWLIIGDAP